jgi:hypothetical protein
MLRYTLGEHQDAIWFSILCDDFLYSDAGGRFEIDSLNQITPLLKADEDL